MDKGRNRSRQGGGAAKFRRTPAFCRLFMRGHAVAGAQGNRVGDPPQTPRGLTSTNNKGNKPMKTKKETKQEQAEKPELELTEQQIADFTKLEIGRAHV